MANEQKKTVYKSFEQFRDEVFPELVDREKTDKIKQDAELFGAYLADKAVDQMLAGLPH